MRNYLTFVFLTLNFLGYSQSNCATKTDSLTQREVYLIADESPKFSNDKDSLINYIYQNLTYPQDCLEGAVYVSFIVEPNGELSNQQIMKGINSDIDKHALKLVNEMPNWIPGKCNSTLVPFYYVLPVHFRLSYNR